MECFGDSKDYGQVPYIFCSKNQLNLFCHLQHALFAYIDDNVRYGSLKLSSTDIGGRSVYQSCPINIQFSHEHHIS